MFLKNPKLLLKSYGFRLITGYTLFITLSSLVINVSAYTVLSSFIYEESREEIEEDLKDLSEIYQEGGLDALKADVFEEEGDPFFVRLMGNQKNILVERVPKDWSDFNVARLEEGDPSEGEAWRWIEGSDGENEFEVTALRLADGAILQLGQKITEREALLSRFRTVYMIAIVPVLLVTYLGGIFIADRAMNPIRQLTHTLQSIVANPRVDVRVPPDRTDSLHKDLIALFNRMLEKIETLVNGMRHVLDHVAHDLRTPMTRLRGMAEMAVQSERSADALREALSDCIEESERVLTMLDTLMDISEAETGAMKLDFQEANLSTLIEETVQLYGEVAEEKGVSIDMNIPEALYLTADRNRIRQVLANLLDNAIKYTPAGGRVDLEADRTEKEIIITVKDTGVGIPPEALPKIWDRLYRADQSRSQRGLGLGLSLVKAVVGAHRGRVDVSSRPGHGALFTVYLPR